MQIRHAKHGDEAALAVLLEDHERHYGNAVPDGAGAAGAAFLVDPPPNATLCLVADGDAGLVGFAILNPYFPAPNLTHGLYLKELYGQQRLAALLRPSRHAAREKGLLRHGCLS